MSARQITAREKQKNQAPTYCPVVVGLNAFEKILTAVFWVLNIIIIAMVISEVAMGMLEDMVEDMPAIVEVDIAMVAEGEADMEEDIRAVSNSRILGRVNRQPREPKLDQFSVQRPNVWSTLNFARVDSSGQCNGFIRT